MIGYGFGVELARLENVIGAEERTFKWRNDPRIFRWTRQNDLLTLANHRAWFQSQQTDPSMRMYAVLQHGLQVGVCGLTSIDLLNRRAEFSLYIDPECHGHGLGRAALATLMCHGFSCLGLEVIWGETFDGNPAAKMFERLGMKKEGTRRAFYYRHGASISAHLYSLLSSEWARLLPTWVDDWSEKKAKTKSGSKGKADQYPNGKAQRISARNKGGALSP